MTPCKETSLIYCDGSAVVADKPSGVDSEKELPALVSEALAESGQTGEIYTVHRLDRLTSGLIILARTKKAAAALSASIAAGELDKRYIALVGGIPDPPEGEMRDLLFFDRRQGRAFTADRERKGVRAAHLAYAVLSSDTEKKRSIVSIRLFTGRTHQIRVQFASRGMPLCGDRRYGSREPPDSYLLRAVGLSFPHPDTGRILEFSLEYPTDIHFFD